MDFQLELKSKLASEGLVLDSQQRDILQRHYDLLSQWQKIHNLTTIEKTVDSVENHYIDCVKGFSLLSPRPQVFDLGSGAGFPGLVGAVLWPESRFMLVEASRKKSSFLQMAIAQMGLKNVEVLTQRVETLNEVEFAISRATFSFPSLMNAAEALLENGELALWVSGKEDILQSAYWSSLPFQLIQESRYVLGEKKERKIWLLKKSLKCFT